MLSVTISNIGLVKPPAEPLNKALLPSNVKFASPFSVVAPLAVTSLLSAKLVTLLIVPPA